MPKSTNGKGPRRLAEAAPHCLVQALRRRSHVLQPGRSCSRLALPKQLHLPNCEACMLKAPGPVYVHTQLLRTLCMTAFLHRIFVHTSKKEEIKLPHLEPRTQRVKDSKPPGLKDSRIQALQDSRIQAFKDSRAHRWKDSAIHVWAFVPRTAAPDLPELNLWIPPEQSIRRHLFQSTEMQTQIWTSLKIT